MARLRLQHRRLNRRIESRGHARSAACTCRPSSSCLLSRTVVVCRASHVDSAIRLRKASRASSPQRCRCSAHARRSPSTSGPGPYNHIAMVPTTGSKPPVGLPVPVLTLLESAMLTMRPPPYATCRFHHRTLLGPPNRGPFTSRCAHIHILVQRRSLTQTKLAPEKTRPTCLWVSLTQPPLRHNQSSPTATTDRVKIMMFRC